MSLIKFLSDKTNADNMLIVAAEIALVIMLFISINGQTRDSWYDQDDFGSEFTNSRREVMTEEEAKREEDEDEKERHNQMVSQGGNEYKLSKIRVYPGGEMRCEIDTIRNELIALTNYNE